MSMKRTSRSTVLAVAISTEQESVKKATEKQIELNSDKKDEKVQKS
jgi:hypothetical protein